MEQDMVNASVVNRGNTLIEVLVSFAILGVGLLGIAGLLLISNKTNNSSYAKQQAVQCIYDIFDKIRTNQQAAIKGSYDISNISTSATPTIPNEPSTKCDATACTSDQMATWDTWYWLANDVSKLPSGSGSIVTSSNSGSAKNTLITITVQWDDSVAQKALETGTGQTSSGSTSFVQLSIQSQL